MRLESNPCDVLSLLTILSSRYVFGKFQTQQGKTVNADDTTNAQYKTIPTFLSLFIFGFIYELVLVWDALRMKNTIQVIGLCVANLALLVYTAIQIDQIHMAITLLGQAGGLKDAPEGGRPETALWNACKGYLIAIPIVLAVGTLCMAFIAWKLYQEFAWDILKYIGADYRMKKRFLYYQVCHQL